MSFRALTVIPALCVLTAIGVLHAFDMPPVVLRIEIELVKVIALLGSLAAASAFEPGDHLRRAWHMSAGLFGLLLVRDSLLLIPEPSASLQIVAALIVLVSNVCGVLSGWYMARTFQVAGLADEASTRRFWIATALSFASAIVLTGPSLLISLKGMHAGEPGAAEWLISGVGDVLSLALIVPILLTAMAMRGGALLYPWALLTATMSFWLLYDIAGTLENLALLQGPGGLAIEELLRALACVYTGAAGLAQRKIVREGAG